MILEYILMGLSVAIMVAILAYIIEDTVYRLKRRKKRKPTAAHRTNNRHRKSNTSIIHQKRGKVNGEIYLFKS